MHTTLMHVWYTKTTSFVVNRANAYDESYGINRVFSQLPDFLIASPPIFLANEWGSRDMKCVTPLSLVLAVLLLVSGAYAHATDVYRIRGPQSEFDTSHAYYAGLLKMALEATRAEFGDSQIVYQGNLNQAREMVELESGKLINVGMVGTSKEREKRLIPIRIPLNKGTLGYRLFIIHKDNQQKFDRIQTIEQLKKLSICQGSDWPDSDIMEAAGFTVIRNQDYESLFEQVSQKRCDFFHAVFTRGLPRCKPVPPAIPI
ncbi:MAG: hypothetical protein R3E89_02655 [Thiolinea sp.]